MRRLSTLGRGFAPLLCLAIVGCSSTRPQTPVPATGHRTNAEGYSLLYGIASQQKELKKLLWVKFESDDVDAVISDLADYTAKLSAELEDMAERYPALSVDTQYLPEVEVKARESIAKETQDVFMSTKGKDFERRLLLKQLSAIEQERHLAKVMVGLETAEERRAFWVRTEQKFTEFENRVSRLLERQYFSS